MTPESGRSLDMLDRPAKRSRIRQACNRCRERKTKCHDQRPCAACIAANVVCEDWRPGDSPVSGQEGGREGDISTIHTPGDLQDLFGLGERVTPAAATASTSAPPPGGPKTGGVGADWPHRPRDDRLLRLAFPFDSLYRNERGLLKSLSMSSGLGALAYLPEHHKLVNAQMDELLNFFVDMPANPLLPPDLSRPPSPRLSPVIDESTWELVSNAIGLQTVWILFRHFQQTAYLLWPTFLLKDLISTVQDTRERCRPEFICLLLSVCAIADRESNGSRRTEPAKPHVAYYELFAEVRARHPTADWSCVTAIQALFYMSMYCFGGSGPYGVSMGHSLINEAVSRAMDIGLHRSVDAYSQTFDAPDVEVRNRTLWAVYCGDKISAAYGRSILLRLSELDVEEINAEDITFHERLDPKEPSFLAHHRACIRLYMVLERVLHKVNIPSCTHSSVLNRLSSSTRRYKETAIHRDDCEAEHRPFSFEAELDLVERFKSEGLPPRTECLEDDNMFYCHVERLRTTAAFIRVFIYRHLFTVLSTQRNSDIGVQAPSSQYLPEMLRWSQDLLASQRKILQRGQLTDIGSICSYQISQIGRAILPAIYLSKYFPSASHQDCMAAVRLAAKLLQDLSLRFSSSLRSLEILEHAAQRLDIELGEGDDTNLGFSQALPQTRGVSGQRSRWISDLPLSNPLGIAFQMTSSHSPANPDTIPTDLQAPPYVARSTPQSATAISENLIAAALATGGDGSTIWDGSQVDQNTVGSDALLQLRGASR